MNTFLVSGKVTFKKVLSNGNLLFGVAIDSWKQDGSTPYISLFVDPEKISEANNLDKGSYAAFRGYITSKKDEKNFLQYAFNVTDVLALEQRMHQEQASSKKDSQPATSQWKKKKEEVVEEPEEVDLDELFN